METRGVWRQGAKPAARWRQRAAWPLAAILLHACLPRRPPSPGLQAAVSRSSGDVRSIKNHIIKDTFQKKQKMLVCVKSVNFTKHGHTTTVVLGRLHRIFPQTR
jgi:hypothetical protein